MKGGNVWGFQAIARDITERKRAEFELQKSRNFVERIAATTPGVLYVFDLIAQRTVFSNREVVAVPGYKPEEIMSFEQLTWSYRASGRSIDDHRPLRGDAALAGRRNQAS